MSVQLPLRRGEMQTPIAAAEAQPMFPNGHRVHEFFENFDVIAGTVGGVVVLRRLILGLGVTGRLLGARPMGEQPAESWSRAPLGDIADCVLGKMLDKAKHRSGSLRPYLRNINVRWGMVDVSDLLEMYFDEDELDRYGVRPGDVLVCEGGEPGRAAVWTEARPMLIQKAIHRVRPSSALLPGWVVLNLRYDTWSGRLDEFFTGATIKHFTGKALKSYELPLPPLAEQQRIVSKVDELMALCDELDAQLRIAEHRAAKLAEAVATDLLA